MSTMQGINILIVDDEPLVSDLIRRKLSKTEPAFNITTVHSMGDCLEFISRNRVDCILSDYQMAGTDGLELLDHLRKSGDTTPFIFVTGQGNEELAREAFKKGAHDYFTKEVGFAHFDRITNSIHQAVSRRIAEEDRLRAERKLSEEKNKLEAVFSAITDGICIVDRDYMPIFFNGAYTSLIGVHTGEKCYSFIQGNDDICTNCPIQRTFADGGVHHARKLVRKSTGNIIVDISSSPLRDHNGDITAAVKVVRDVTEQSLSDQLMAESEDKFRTLAEKSPNMIFINQGGSVLYANELCEKVTGLTREEIYAHGFDFRSFVAPEYLDVVESNFNRHMQGENVPPYEYELISPNGERLAAIITTRLINYAGGRAILGIITDITERKKAEKRLAASESMYRLMFEDNPAPMLVYELESLRILSANAAAVSLYGYSREELLSMTIKDLRPPEDVPMLLEFLVSAHEGYRKSGEWKYVRKDGGIIFGEVLSHPIEFEGKSARLIQITDVTSRVAAEKSLKESEARYRTLMENAGDAILLADTQTGLILDANRKAEILFGIKREKLVGIHQTKLHPEAEAEKYAEIFREHVARGSAITDDVLIKRGDGTVAPVEISSSIIKLDGREVNIGIFRDTTERIHSEEEKDRLLKGISTISEGIAFADRDGRYVYMNEAHSSIFGYTPGEMLGKTWRMIIPPDMLEPTEMMMTSLREKGTGDIGGEGKVLKKDGSVISVEFRLAGFFGADGDYEGHVCIARDVTRRRLIEEKLARSEERYREAEAVARIGNWQWLIDKDEVVWSDGMFAIFGLDPAEFGRTYNSYLDFVQPEDKDRVMGLVSESLTGKPLNYITAVICPDGAEKYIHVYGRLSYNSDGRPERLFGTVQDVTDKVLSDKALRASEERHRVIFESGAVGIAVSDPDGNFFEANPAFCGIVGYSEDELLEKDVAFITHPDDREETRKQMDALRSGVQNTIDFEKRYIRRNGTAVWARVTVTRHHVPGMLQPYFIAMVQDITSRKTLEKQREELFAMLRHDMKTPLALISGNADMVMDESKSTLTKESTGMLDAIKSSALSLTMMVDDLAAISRLEYGDAVPMEKVDTVDMLLEVSVVASERARAKGLGYNKNIPDNLPSGTFNRSYVQRAVSNLIDNAVKFTPKGGSVSLEAGTARVNETDQIYITVSDTGPGISEHEKDLVFEKYYRSKRPSSPKGSGLGLAIVKAVASLHGGSVELAGREGHGCTFTLHLPVMPGT